VQSLPADLNLTFKSGKIVLVKPKEFALATKHYQALYCLGKQKLVVEWHVRTTVLQGKNNPDPHCLFIWGKKILVNQTPLLKISFQRKAKVLKIKRIEPPGVRIISILTPKH